jgi:LacI family transcriptional regulator
VEAHRLVQLDRRTSGPAPATGSSGTAGRPGGVRHLAQHGYRRVGYLGDEPDIYTAVERMRGFRLAVSTLGLDCDPGLVRQGLHDSAVAQEQALSMLVGANPPAAQFAGNNVITAGVLRAPRRRRGERISLVGFDGFDLADLIDPPVTVIAVDAQALGRRAAERLFSRLAGNEGSPQTEVLATRLIVRGSGEVRP